MARREHFEHGTTSKDSHGHCTHCGTGLGSAGTMRRGGDMFNAEGATVYTKRRDELKHMSEEGEMSTYAPGKYCSNCSSEAEAAERANDR